MIVGLDVGASFVKAVLADTRLEIVRKYTAPVNEPKTAVLKILNSIIEENNVGLKNHVKAVALSGGGSRFIEEEMLSLPVKRINEIAAIGVGGLLLARKNDGLIVSAGTGTAIVTARDGGKIIRHVGGTGVGGGTIIGLSRRILGVSDFKVLEEMALRGDSKRVDLTVGDIVGGPIGIIPADATASNFGKLTCESRVEDISAGIFNMVSQTIGVLAVMAAKLYGLEDSIIFVGMLPKSKIVSEIIRETVQMFGARAIIPGDCEFANALGAAAIAQRNTQ